MSEFLPKSNGLCSVSPQPGQAAGHFVKFGENLVPGDAGRVWVSKQAVASAFVIFRPHQADQSGIVQLHLIRGGGEVGVVALDLETGIWLWNCSPFLGGNMEIKFKFCISISN